MRDRIEIAFANWGRIAFRHAWRITGIVVILAGSLISQLPKITIDTSTEAFLEEDDPVRITYAAFREEFGRDERLLIALRPAEIFDLAFLTELRGIHRDLEREVPRIQDIQSLINARHTYGDGDRLVVGELLEDWPENAEDVARIREIAMASPLYRNILLSEDGRLTTISIETDAYSTLDEDSVDAVLDQFDVDVEPAETERRFITTAENREIVEAVERVIARYAGPDLEIFVAGTPMMTDHFQKTMTRDMGRFSGMALVTIAICLGVLFRRAAGVVLPLTVSVLSLLCTLSVMAILEIPVSLPTQILPSFLLSVGVGNAVHVLVIFFQARQRGESKEEAIAFALGHSGLAIVMTALTTSAGLLSFLSAELALIADFGLMAPIGVMLALVYTIVLLPALISIIPIRDGGVRETSFDRRTRRLLISVGVYSTRHAAMIVSVTAVILAVSFAGALQVRFAHDPLIWFPEDDPFRIATELMNEELKGTMFLEVLIDTGKENGLHEPDMLNRLEELRRFTETLEYKDVFVGKTISIADVLKETHQALNENRAEFYTVPQDRLLVAQELLLFENSGSDDLEDLVDSRFSKARFTIKIPFVDSIQYGPFFRMLDARLAEIMQDKAEYAITGLMAIMGGTFNAVIYSMASTYLIAFSVITPLMILLIGRFRIGLLSMIPNLGPIVLTLGMMRVFDFPLNAFTLLIGSIAIGLAVDDTIHFMHNFRRYYEASGNVEEAVAETLASTGQALLFTSIVLATGFFIYTFASMNNLFHFGVLTGFTVVTAFIADVVLGPALLALVFRRQAPKTMRAHTLEGN